jgi:RNA polymerase sigma-70 factor (ECF subfamily)
MTSLLPTPAVVWNRSKTNFDVPLPASRLVAGAIWSVSPIVHPFKTRAIPSHDPERQVDVALFQRMGVGDAEAMDLFYDRHSSCLYGLALKMLRDEQDAQDVLQDTLITIWNKASNYDPGLSSPLSWAVMVLRHKAIDIMRSSERRQKKLERTQAEFWCSSDMDDFSAGEPLRRELRQTVRQAMARLRPEQRCVLDLAYFSDLSHTEIAERLRLPLGTVKTVIRRSLIELRQQLQTAI